MSGGPDSPGQSGNRPPEPPWGNVPPWERAGQPPEPPPRQDDDQDTAAYDQPGQSPPSVGETVFGAPAQQPDGGYGQDQPPSAGETVLGGPSAQEYGGEHGYGADAPHFPALPDEPATEAGERHIPAIPPEEAGERHIPAIPPEEAGGDPYLGYGQQGPYGGQPQYGDQPPLGGTQGPYGQGGGPQGPQGPPPPGGGYGPPPSSGGGGAKVPLIVALVVAGVLVLGGITAGGFALVRAGSEPTSSPSATSSSSSPAPTLTAPTPSSSPSASSLPLPQRINERSHDPSPLTLKELFPATYKGENGYTYKRYKSKLYESCSPAVKGTKLRSALKKGKCSQVAAATYVDKKHKTLITVGLANMTDLSASKRVDKVVDPPKDIVFKPLDGRSPAKFSRRSYYQWAEPVGHYVRWSAATYTNRSPSRGESYEKLSVANGDMNSLLNGPLSVRMLKAKP